MKVLLINNHFCNLGGADRVFLNEANLLERNGHKVIYFCGKHPNNLKSEFDRYFVSPFAYGIGYSLRGKASTARNLLYSLEARDKLEKLINEEKPDVAHLHNIYHQISPSVLHSLKRFNIPVVMTLHDYKLVCAAYLLYRNNKICELCKNGKYYQCFLTVCVKHSRSKSLLNTFEMYLHHKILKIYKLVDIYISPSNFLKNKMQEMGFKSQVIHLSNFVNLNGFIRPKNLPGNYITYFGRMSDEKGLLTLVSAWKDIKTTFLKIIGEGPIERIIKERIERENIKNVILMGRKDEAELENIIRGSLFTVVPSEWYENNPLAILESFSFEKPVVASRIGGIPELVKEGETGALFEPGNIRELVNKIQYLIDNPSLVLQMGKRARNKVETECSPQKHYVTLMEIYKKVIDR